ncbi:sodium-dependent neutral amino acid transporter SLC6A17-like [Acipenser ruthenus]|uniref:sodium-dependent neutral amino acid transporter SLC6A17-like n=1 Tax=Acipenser ruthenus TaxID=7906 RepID=UPI0027424D69|nr:sodium-dependent neutral amino acid transporter SLC6A17-like [Acipenser ruthenus]
MATLFSLLSWLTSSLSCWVLVSVSLASVSSLNSTNSSSSRARHSRMCWVSLGVVGVGRLVSGDVLSEVMYFSSVFPYLVLLCFLIRGVMLEGAADGIKYMFYPRLQIWLDMQVWRQALTQVFFALGLGFGSVIAYSSYNPRGNNCHRDAVLVSGVNFLTSLLASLVVFAVLGFRAHALSQRCVQQNLLQLSQLLLNGSVPLELAPQFNVTGGEVSVSQYRHWFEQQGALLQAGSLEPCDLQEEMSKGVEGTGLAFITFTEAMALFPASPLWSFLFFLMLLNLGLSTMFGTMQGILTPLMDSFSVLRRRRSLFTVGSCVLGFLFGVLCALRSGRLFLSVFDDSSVCVFVVSVGSCVLVFLFGVLCALRSGRLFLSVFDDSSVCVFVVSVGSCVLVFLFGVLCALCSGRLFLSVFDDSSVCVFVVSVGSCVLVFLFGVLCALRSGRLFLSVFDDSSVCVFVVSVGSCVLVFLFGVLCALCSGRLFLSVFDDSSVCVFVVSVGSCVLGFLFGMLFVLRSGSYFVSMFDDYSATLPLVIVVLFETVGVCWVYGTERFMDDIEDMLGWRPPVLYKFLWQFVCVASLVVLLLASLIQMCVHPPTYRAWEEEQAVEVSRDYPGWGLGMLAGLILLASLPIPVLFLRELLRERGDPEQPASLRIPPPEPHKSVPEPHAALPLEQSRPGGGARHNGFLSLEEEEEEYRLLPQEEERLEAYRLLPREEEGLAEYRLLPQEEEGLEEEGSFQRTATTGL